MELYENEIIRLIDNDFVQVIYKPTKNYLKIKWKQSVKNLTTQEAIEVTKKVFKQLEKYNPEYVLQDNSDIHFNYTNDYLNWVLSKLTPRLAEIGVRKIVYVEPAEIITKIGLQIFFDQAYKITKGKLERNIVNSVAEAEIWLFEDEPLDYTPFSTNDD